MTRIPEGGGASAAATDSVALCGARTKTVPRRIVIAGAGWIVGRVAGTKGGNEATRGNRTWWRITRRARGAARGAAAGRGASATGGASRVGLSGAAGSAAKG